MASKEYSFPSIQEQKDYFKKIFDFLPVGIVILDGLKVKNANKKFCNMTGLKPEKLLGREFISILPDEKDREYAKSVLKELKNNKEIECECTISWNKHRHFVRIKAIKVNGETILNIIDTSEMRKLMDSSIQGIMIYQDDRIIYANKQIERITGYKKEELFDMKPWEIVTDEYKSTVKRVAKLRQQGKMNKNKVYEIKIKRKDGKEKWALISSTAINYRGKSSGLVTLIDTTDLKLMADIIHERENLLQKIFDNASEGIFIEKVEEEGIKIIDANDAACRIVGYEKDELIGMDANKLIHPDDREIAKKILKEMEKNSNKNVRFEGRNIRKDGSVVYLEMSASWINIEGNKYIMIIARDITEKKLAEERLAESEAIFRAIAETSPNGIFILVNDEITFVNSSFERITGYNLKDIKKMGVPYIYGYGEGTEIKIKRKDGEMKWVIFSIKELNVKGKRIKVGILTDITDVRKAYETKRKFIEDTSHYFFNPIAIAKGYLELAMEKSDGEKDKMLSKVKEAVERIENVVKNIVEKGEIHE